jgi:hypothetical protein
MSDLGQIQFLKGSLRYKGASDQSVQLTIPLRQKSKEIDELDRVIGFSLAELYEIERQKSKLFAPSCKFQFIFSNAYSGTTTFDFNQVPYPPFNNNLYYENSEATKLQQVGVLEPIQWPGSPQYTEFSFIRTDYNVMGYTAPPDEHVLSLPKDKTNYNWSFYLSYPYENDDSILLYYQFENGDFIYWKPIDGLPYQMKRVESLGKTLWQFTCPVNHNLSVGEFISIQNVTVIGPGGLPVQNTRSVFEVYSLGDGTFESDKNIFNIIDVGYFQSSDSFLENKVGQFSRIIDNSNITESKSKYYIRKNKIITEYNESILTNSGFEQNAFRTVKKYESASLTPNYFARVSTKEDSQSYNLSFSRTFNFAGILDNLNRPLTRIHMTVLHRGYFGYFNPPNVDGVALKQGWGFNISSDSNSWWERDQSLSNTNVSLSYYTKNGLTFYYNDFLQSGDTLHSDLCEWNNTTLIETTLSDCYHKIVFNPETFNINTSITNPLGYYYKPFYEMKLQEYSDYIENGNPNDTDAIPNYAFYSAYNDRMYWRDLYTYGFIDSNGVGVNYPFMNGKHYPYSNFVFKLIPEGTNILKIKSIQDPIIDGCE